MAFSIKWHRKARKELKNIPHEDTKMRSGNLSIEKFINILAQHLPELKKQYHIDKLELFGSRVRKQEKNNSDLDILVSFNHTPSLIEFVDLKNHLTDLLGVEVDLVMKDALKPRLRERILEEVVLCESLP